MPSIAELLEPEQVHSNFAGHSRKKILQLVAESLAKDSNDEESSTDEIYDGLMERERLGSTGFGDGVAIPHCRMNCEKMQGAFVSLSEPIDYESIDGEPVDLIFVLIVPKNENTAHLETLAVLAHIFGESTFRQRLRAANTDEELRATMLSIEGEIATQANVVGANSS
jgi:PTS system nitrogen regulatory IIA component